MDLMTRLNRAQGITIVMVTHEPDIAACAQRLLHFVDGKLEAEVAHRREADHVL
jgi:putative ABC transport system ATP-binding protein